MNSLYVVVDRDNRKIMFEGEQMESAAAFRRAKRLNAHVGFGERYRAVRAETAHARGYSLTGTTGSSNYRDAPQRKGE